MEKLILECCPVCASNSIDPVLKIYDVPVYCNVLWETKAKAIAAPQGLIDLAFCLDCGHLFNQIFNHELLEYSPDYENSLHYSIRFQEYAFDLANELIERHKLKEKKVLEIACGKGDFLRMLCRSGSNNCIGFDPSYVKNDTIMNRDCNINIYPEYFNSKNIHMTFDLICCRHMLEHLQRPTEFLSELRKDISNPKIVLFFEVPNAFQIINNIGIWDLIYEHCSYFWEESLRQAMENAGYKVERIWETFERQFLCIESTLKFENVRLQVDKSKLRTFETSIMNFKVNYLNKIQQWKEHLLSFKENKEKVVVWGAGSKGVTFLNILKDFASIEFVVDLNSKKQGKFIPCTGQKVVPPDYLKSYLPDKVIIMNDIYYDEIFKLLCQLGINTEILIA